jgi:hypothetical protein
MDSVTYRRQPAVVTCPAGCTLDALKTLVRGHPRNPIWVDGDLTIGAGVAYGDLGQYYDLPTRLIPLAMSDRNPLLLIVDGTLRISANAQIDGFVYARNILLDASANASHVMGAIVSENGFTSLTTPALPATLTYDPAMLDFISLYYGSFVRIPGSWNLYSN